MTLSIGGVVLSAVGVWLAVKSRKTFRLTYFTAGFTLPNYRDRIPQLNISFKGIPISTLTVSRVAIWNAGSEPLLNSALVRSDHLRINVRDGAILESSVLKTTNRATDFRVGAHILDKPFGNTVAVEVAFDFLNPGDGGVIEIVHTAEKRNSVTVVGSIIGVGRPTRVKSRLPAFPLQILALVLFGVLLIDLVKFPPKSWPEPIRTLTLIIVGVAAANLSRRIVGRFRKIPDVLLACLDTSLPITAAREELETSSVIDDSKA